MADQSTAHFVNVLQDIAVRRARVARARIDVKMVRAEQPPHSCGLVPAPLGECALLQVAVCGKFGRLLVGIISFRAEERVRIVGLFNVEVIDALDR